MLDLDRFRLPSVPVVEVEKKLLNICFFSAQSWQQNSNSTVVITSTFSGVFQDSKNLVEFLIALEDLPSPPLHKGSAWRARHIVVDVNNNNNKIHLK